MKSNSSPLPVGAVLFAGLIAIAGTNCADAQSLDPHTGMPVIEKLGVTHFDPATGLTGSDATNAAQIERATILEIGAINARSAAAGAHLNNVISLMSQGYYEDALQRCLTSQSQPKTESESQMLFSQWAELGRHYPPAEQALRKIRDEDTRQFSAAGGGSLVLFAEVACLNRLLNDEAATGALFKQIANQNPPLADYYYPVAEDALFSQGEYSSCLSFIGDPQKRFASYQGGFNAQRGIQQDMETWAKNNPPPICYLPLTSLPDSRPAATNGFVDRVCKLVEFLVATGNRAGAENIRTQAVAVAGSDPRLSAAVSAAEENIKKTGMVSLPTTGLPQYAGDHLLAERGLVLACAVPTETIHNLSPFAQVPIWTAKGQYDQALRLIRDLCDYLPSFPFVNTVLPDWKELALIYPPARQSMIEIRNRDAREFEQPKDGFNAVGLFLEARQLNDALGETNATYAMAKRLEQHNPAQFQARFYLLEPLLMQHGDYPLCLKYLGDPQANLEMMFTNLEFMRKVLPLWRRDQTNSRRMEEETLNKAPQSEAERNDQRKQFEQELLAKRLQSRQELWAQLRTNTPDADEMPLSFPPHFMPIQTNLPTYSVHNWQLPPAGDGGLAITNFFVGRVCVMVDILVAADHKAEAENIRNEAELVLDDPRLKSAVTDAEQKLTK